MNNINIFYIFSALLFGMIHAIEPGHGKSLIATYVLGSNVVKKRDALLIGLFASITHTASVYFIGFIGIKFLEFIFPAHKEACIGLTASLIIFLIGSWLIWDRIINPLFRHNHEHECSAHKILTKNLKATSVLVIGLTAGLIPCSGGLAVFLTVTAVEGFKNFLNGFFYVLSYSIGLGLALTIIALTIIYGQELIKGKLEKSITNLEKSSGVISAIIIYTLGLILLTANIVTILDLGHHHIH